MRLVAGPQDKQIAVSVCQNLKSRFHRNRKSNVGGQRLGTGKWAGVGQNVQTIVRMSSEDVRYSMMPVVIIGYCLLNSG